MSKNIVSLVVLIFVAMTFNISVARIFESDLSRMFEQDEETNDSDPNVEPEEINTNIDDSLTLMTFNDKQYYYSFDQPKMSWSNARRFCREMGMDLVSLETKEEWLAVKSLVPQLTNAVGMDPWAGASDRGHEGDWVWASSLQGVTYTAYSGCMQNRTGEDCMWMWSGGWCAGDCHLKRSFVCEENKV